MRVLIVDDEALARRRLARMLERIEGIELVGEAADGVEALERVAALEPELLLLDVDMPELDGVSLAGRLAAAETPVAVVFTTAHPEHAVEAFALEAVDYLLKPIKHERLVAALERVRSRSRDRPRDDAARVAEAVAQRLGSRASSSTPRISARHGETLRVFDAREIERFYAADKYSGFCQAGVEYLLDDSLSVLEARLGEHEFVRVHRRELINLGFVLALHLQDGGAELELRSGARVLVSRRSLAGLRKRLGG